MACNRCFGTGYLPHYAHIQGGVCFRCGGTGNRPGDGPSLYHVQYFTWVLDEPEPRLVIGHKDLTADLVKEYVEATVAIGPFSYVFVFSINGKHCRGYQQLEGTIQKVDFNKAAYKETIREIIEFQPARLQ